MSSSYSGVSTSSVLDLKAELSKQVDNLQKSGTGYTRSKEKRQASTGSSSTSWLKRNAGVAKRAARDRVLLESRTEGHGLDPERSRAILEQKAQIYDSIRKGKSGGLNEGQIDSLLVDFDRKNWDDPVSSDNDLENPAASDENELVNFTDEYGRTRKVARRDLPRQPEVVTEERPEDTNVTYGDQHFFPVYQPDSVALAARRAKAAEPIIKHYDATAENRAKAAGFYNFATDEELRTAQMTALKRAREETEFERVKRLQSTGETEASRAKGQRRKQIEEKRQQIQAKRTPGGSTTTTTSGL